MLIPSASALREEQKRCPDFAVLRNRICPATSGTDQGSKALSALWQLQSPVGNGAP
jgi:hypothetical protein